MNKVQGKFRVTEVATVPHYAQWPEDPDRATRVRMGAVKHPLFGRATPSGSIEMLIVNPEAAAYFPYGSEHYVTFEHAED